MNMNQHALNRDDGTNFAENERLPRTNKSKTVRIVQNITLQNEFQNERELKATAARR